MPVEIPALRIEEEDGSPTGQPAVLKVSNGTLTDNGDGTFSVTTGAGGGSSEWTDTGTTLHPTETGDDVVIGGTSPVSSAKLSIDGDADQIQCVIQGNSTQTSELLIVETSAGSNLFRVDASGNAHVAASITHEGDSDTGMSFATDKVQFDVGGKELLVLDESSSPKLVAVNNDQSNVDFRVSTEAQANMFYVDAGGDWAGFGGNTLANSDVTIQDGGATTFNEQGNSVDFTVEGNTDTACFVVDGSADSVGIGDSSPSAKLDINGDIHVQDKTDVEKQGLGTHADSAKYCYTKTIATFQTTSSTATNNDVYTVANDEAVSVVCTLIGIKTDGSQMYHGRKATGYRKDGAASITQVGTVYPIWNEITEQSPASYSLTTTGTATVRVAVAGASSETWNWTLVTEIYSTK